MPQASFKVYNASAGAGKTFSLVQEYLSIALQEPSRFRQILAITFTNKAAYEMKERILLALEKMAFYKVGDEKPSELTLLQDKLGWREETLVHRAQEVLENILHQYSAFSVSTIDKFTNRLIRSFSRDLQLSGNYEVELDSERLITEAVRNMLDSLEAGQAESEVISAYIRQKLEDGKSPHPEHQLVKTGKLIFEEKAFIPLQALSKLKLPELQEIAKNLRKRQKDFKAHFSTRAKEILDFILAAGLEFSDFNRSTIPNQLKKIAAGEMIFFSKTALPPMLGESPFYPKSKAKQVAGIFEAVEQDLLNLTTSFVRDFSEAYAIHHMDGKILKDFYSLMVITDIERHVEELKTENNTLPIGQFNKIIHEKIVREPAMYLFEKIGNRYRHFFVDEFQDTSVLQWQNLIPLVNNAMAERIGSTMIVGDGKQSIYRWRGGEVGQFLDLSNDKDPSNLIESTTGIHKLYEREAVQLEHNWRSRKEIVGFNNAIFTRAAHFLDDEAHQKLYTEAGQQEMGADGGYVHMRFFEKDLDTETYQQTTAAYIITQIEDALKRGYSYKDITILTRKNDEGVYLSEKLLEAGFPVISAQSLLLEKSKLVQAVISFFGTLARPDDPYRRLALLEFLKDEQEASHHFLEHLAKAPLPELLQKIESRFPDFNQALYEGMGITQKLYHLYQSWGLPFTNDPYLQLLLDKVGKLEQEGLGTEAELEQWWIDEGHRTSLSLPEGSNSLTIMTLHKAKGLEFKVTLLAFADWSATTQLDSNAWIPLNEEQFFGLPVARVSLSDPKEEPVLEIYKYAYEQNKNAIQLDQLNMLYVALTRAVDELYILAKWNDKAEPTDIIRYLKAYAEEHGLTEDLLLEKGTKVEPRLKESTPENILDPHLEWIPWQDKLRIVTDAPTEWNKPTDDARSIGDKVHRLLANIKTVKDVDTELEHAFKAGWFPEEEQPSLLAQLQQIVQHPDLKLFYQDHTEVLNERDILLPEGKTKRPDRLVFKDGLVHILDYKTGEEKSSHKGQVLEYARLLEEIGLQTGEKLLIYLGEKINVVSCKPMGDAQLDLWA